MNFLQTFLNIIYWAFWILILARVILSFIRIDPYHPLVRLVYDLTEPILAPIRRILPPMSGLDFSPLIALLLLQLLFRLITELI